MRALKIAGLATALTLPFAAGAYAADAIMSPPPAPPAAPPSDVVNVEVDGKAAQGKKGQMIIHVTDAQNAYVPRFCYHDKLPIAANCRMCLVEVEKAPKPLPACATPIGEGMKIFTKSPKAIGSQKATMEFLLINHPLDCPICDQGGECDLQDQAMAYGFGGSRYIENKRAVEEKYIGPLIKTFMNRCIHCTRCVRFMTEVAGVEELGAIGRGEDMEITTYLDRGMPSPAPFRGISPACASRSALPACRCRRTPRAGCRWACSSAGWRCSPSPRDDALIGSNA